MTRTFTKTTTRYIFIDEAQDLSVSELELIRKINTYQDDTTEIEPIINAFGDVNQMISSHGIKSWNDIEFISTEHQLNENFRNPNQIVSFCNKRLPISMKEVGVDMEEVDIFESIKQAINCSSYLKEPIVFIVKDEYAKKDLLLELQYNQISEPSVYTVKEVKGLEFKTVCVVDREMTPNEKYIAYTRALVKLIVVETLTKYVDETEKLFVEGDEDENGSMDIESLDLSVRTFNCLKRAGVNTVNDLLHKKDLRVGNDPYSHLHWKQFEEVKLKLSELGIQLEEIK